MNGQTLSGAYIIRHYQTVLAAQRHDRKRFKKKSELKTQIFSF